MKDLITDTFLGKLIPILTDETTQEIMSYHIVYHKYAIEISERLIEDLRTHPVFSVLITSFPKEVLAERSRLSIEFQKEAIVNNDWTRYIKHQTEQGIAYAKMGFDFKSWFELVTVVRDYIIPYLKKEYSNAAELLAAINGMNSMMDIGMSIIGEAYLQEKQEKIQADQKIIKKLNEELEQKVIERTAELEAVNQELEAFAFSVSHDLRAPLRAINGYAQILAEDYAEKLDAAANKVIEVITKNAQKMGVLIDDLLTFSRLGRKEVLKGNVDMTELVKAVVQELNAPAAEYLNLVINVLPPILGDYVLLKQVWINLISNALKFSSTKPNPKIEIGATQNKEEITYYIKDNGVGFDMQYYNKLFGVFQRLHGQDEFEGTGIGLAIIQRVVNAHGGKVWAEATLNEGATFFMSLPIYKDFT